MDGSFKNSGVYIILEDKAKRLTDNIEGFEIAKRFYSQNRYCESDEGIINGIAGMVYAYNTINNHDRHVVYFIGKYGENKICNSIIQKANTYKAIEYLHLNKIYTEILNIDVKTLCDETIEKSAKSMLLDLLLNEKEIFKTKIYFYIIGHNNVSKIYQMIDKKIDKKAVRYNIKIIDSYEYTKHILESLHLDSNFIYNIVVSKEGEKSFIKKVLKYIRKT